MATGVGRKAGASESSLADTTPPVVEYLHVILLGSQKTETEYCKFILNGHRRVAKQPFASVTKLGAAQEDFSFYVSLSRAGDARSEEGELVDLLHRQPAFVSALFPLPRFGVLSPNLLRIYLFSPPELTLTRHFGPFPRAYRPPALSL